MPNFAKLIKEAIIMAIFLWSSLVFGSESFVLPNVTPFPGSSAVIGQIEAKPECKTNEIVAWLSQGDVLLYQVDVAQHGSFEFHVMPGKYNLVATSSTGCFAETGIDLKKDTVQTVSLTPSIPPKNEHSQNFFDWIVPNAYADCPYCNMMAYYQMQPSFMPSTMPWWGYYGAMAYPPTFAYPGPWTGSAVNGSYFPGNGGVGLDKPVLYLDGKDGTDVSVQLTFPSKESNWLVAVPAHGNEGWQGKLKNNHIEVDGAEHRFLFYDYRSDPNLLQDKKGFCAKRSDLIPKMKNALKNSGFKENEIKDFQDYWSFKIPPSSRYCVYPQGAAEIGQLARLKIEPTPTSLTQIIFIIQTAEALAAGGRFFSHEPVETWVANPPADNRTPASGDSLRAREWGVGFMMTTHTNATKKD